ncbi:MAG: aldo/keto reductase [Peptococcaceae bacterium]|nr:aldo/keto reductase [Peptococcaceae bacterium]
MKRVRLGVNGPWVSQICFGSLAVSPLQGRVSPAEGQEIFRYACELGIDWVDTAEIYENYRLLAPVLAEFPAVRVVSKSYAVTYEEMENSLALARDELGRDFIDIFLLHEQEGLLTLRGHSEAWERLIEARDAGQVGWIGISTHTVNGVREGCLFPGMQVIQTILNYAGLGIVGGSSAQMLAAVRLASEVGVGVYAMKVFGGGHLMRTAKEAMDYIMGLPDVPAMALGMSARAEVDYNVRYVSGLPLDDETVAGVDCRERQLTIADWCDGCGECLDSCPSQALSLVKTGSEVAAKCVVDKRRCVLCGYCGRVCRHFCLKIV